MSRRRPVPNDDLTTVSVCVSPDEAKQADTMPLVTNSKGDMFCPVSLEIWDSGKWQVVYRRCDLCTQEERKNWEDAIPVWREQLKHSEFYIPD
jgi:hypothetical protein